MSVLVAGVRIKRVPQIVYYDATDFPDLGVNEYVIVDTDKCRQAARVVIAPTPHASFPADTPLHRILRRATALDLAQWQEWRLQEPLALAQRASGKAQPADAIVGSGI